MRRRHQGTGRVVFGGVSNRTALGQAASRESAVTTLQSLCQAGVALERTGGQMAETLRGAPAGSRLVPDAGGAGPLLDAIYFAA